MSKIPIRGKQRIKSQPPSKLTKTATINTNKNNATILQPCLLLYYIILS